MANTISKVRWVNIFKKVIPVLTRPLELKPGHFFRSLKKGILWLFLKKEIKKKEVNQQYSAILHSPLNSSRQQLESTPVN